MMINMSEKIHICHVPEPILRETCKAVPVNTITDPATQKILKEMSLALIESGDGVAIAAPQIGYAVRIFVVAGQTFDVVNNYHGEHTSPDRVFINPEIIKESKTKKIMRGEGCLSVRFVYGTTKRSERVTVKAFDAQGKEFIIEGKGLLAQIFQHEIDHLDGILFIDHANDVREMTPEEQSDYEQELIRMRTERIH
jgi:peptide deformylase